MSKKIIAVNAGPRMGWNTETLISEASRGATTIDIAVIFPSSRWDITHLVA